MKFVLSDEDLAKLMTAQTQGLGATFYNAEMVFVLFETDRKIVKKFVPKPLKLAAIPYGMVFFAHYPKVSFGSVYDEAALYLGVEHEGVMGSYCLAMPLTDDMALILGREVSGFPKKIAEEITLTNSDNGFEGRCIRRGTELIKLSMNFDKEVETDEFIKNMSAISSQTSEGKYWEVVSYNFKYFMNPEGTGFDFKPKLVKISSNFKPQSKIKITNTFELKLNSSDRDPLGDIPVKKPLMGFHGIFTFTLQPGIVVAEVGEMRFMPYAFSKIDFIGE